MSSTFTLAAVFAGLSLISVPAAAQRGGGAPQPEGCPGPPQWQLDRNAAGGGARPCCSRGCCCGPWWTRWSRRSNC